MASHLSAQHSRYPHSSPQNEDALRLPSIKDLGFRYPSRRAPEHQDPSSHASPTTIAPSDTQENNSARWARSSQSTPHVQHHLQQQLTPPLSAGHEPKNDYSSKPDGTFLTPGIPLSAQATPVPGSVTIGPGTRGDDPDQSKRRRHSLNMSTSRDQRSSHTAYPPHYAPYPPSQSPQQAYQMQTPMSHPGPPVQQPIDHVAAQQQVAPPPHPGYPTYQPQYHHPPPTRIQLHSAPQQQQAPPPGNPYPPAPAPPPHGSWEQHPAQPPHQHQPPPPPQLQQPPTHLPPPQHAPQIQQPPHSMPQHPQPPQPPPHSLPPQHHHMHPQHPPQPHHSQQPIAPPSLGHHAPPQPQPHQAPPQMQQPQIPYARTTAIVPIDTRSQYPVADERMPLSARDSTMHEIMRLCQILFDFASRYAQIQQSMPDVSPSPTEIQEMSHRAAEVVRLLEEYRRFNLPESERVKMDSTVAMTPPDDPRPRKRLWQEEEDENSVLVDSTTFAEQQYPTPVENKLQTTAEQDMEIIRTKRATSTAGASGSSGQPKSKYRKRSRATPPGKCHSCNIRETPEWRRGPDGARTLCNACGLHYAKLQRKREKQAGQNGEVPPRIDMETLRASARAAEIDKANPRTKNARSQQSNESTSPMEPGKPLPQQHHQGSFQLVPMVVTQDPVPAEPSRAPPQHQQQPPPTMGGAPTPPWQASVQPSSTIRAYAPDQLQQSFMRTSHQATNHTPAR